MKLSEAIVLGSTMAPLGYWFVKDDDGGNVVSACHMGRALLAVGRHQCMGDYLGALRSQWPWFTKKLSREELPYWILDSDIYVKSILGDEEWPIAMCFNMAYLCE